MEGCSDRLSFPVYLETWRPRPVGWRRTAVCCQREQAGRILIIEPGGRLGSSGLRRSRAWLEGGPPPAVRPPARRPPLATRHSQLHTHLLGDHRDAHRHIGRLCAASCDPMWGRPRPFPLPSWLRPRLSLPWLRPAPQVPPWSRLFPVRPSPLFLSLRRPRPHLFPLLPWPCPSSHSAARARPTVQKEPCGLGTGS